ncbi:MAG: hypothetical protein WB789_09155 [Thermoplasmata archaeon]
MALPTERELCRKCGGPLSPGYVDAGAPLIPGTIFWHTGSAAADGPFSTGQPLAPIPFVGLNRWHRFPALHCPACKLVEISYE